MICASSSQYTPSAREPGERERAGEQAGHGGENVGEGPGQRRLHQQQDVGAGREMTASDRARRLPSALQSKPPHARLRLLSSCCPPPTQKGRRIGRPSLIFVHASSDPVAQPPITGAATRAVASVAELLTPVAALAEAERAGLLAMPVLHARAARG